jgi:hypothetical protein
LGLKQHSFVFCNASPALLNLEINPERMSER